MQADVLDAAGFSSAIPGFIHYDVLRDDRIHEAFPVDQPMASTASPDSRKGDCEHLPARPVYEEVMKGRITRRNAFVLAMDCFAPTPVLYFGFCPAGGAPNVMARRFANHYFPPTRRLSPMNLVPSGSTVDSMRWTRESLDDRCPSFMRCERFGMARSGPRYWSGTRRRNGTSV